MMKSLMLLVALAALGLALVGPATTQVRAAEQCPHPEATIDALAMCVQHAASEGHIDSQGVAISLLAKLDAAQTAVDRGETSVAINLLRAFINEVRAQSGNHIHAEHAQHMIMHANQVIRALR
jgi:hypothetical protein